MRAFIPFAFLVFFFSSTAVEAQYGNRYGNQSRRPGGRSTIPQAQAPPKEPEAKTADQIVDESMAKISEHLGLDPFEEAVVRTALIKSVRKQIELRILGLEPEKMKEEVKKLAKIQDEEIKAGLPEEKYTAYKELQKNRGKITKKKKKKKKKSKT